MTRTVHKKYQVHLTGQELQDIKTIIKKGVSANTAAS
jgi:hypothetical protein